ncbi:N-acetylglucosamine-6-phosphate deacetylase [Thalassomonas sp. M1454]|uniref:N-acetylglucosamine-6-phosphate deacetylase n=1 Tax=Thalassomonas sp. M1454 TaxID=2594477 RepID=UPI001181738D|nr:N-acetylglucosamine-6-phosphate deacetylase [Thalassomonas sp. M1454]TRX55669.1 N-acetylglucosamine-6-phosphate deacetylase [Thalassomonas sp. M1454]
MICHLHPEHFFDGQSIRQNICVSIEHGKIVAVAPAGNEQAEKISGLMAPGFIDVQVNGGGGALFNSSPTVAAIKTIGAAHAQFGTTGFLPTLITDKVEVMQKAADAVSQAINENAPGVLGVHFEGPHLSIPKKGVHSPEFIRKISDEEMAVFTRQDLGKVIVTLAPENVAVEDIKTLVDAGVRVCLGHSNADFTTVCNALSAGATGFTHLFNAMSAFQAREPGMVGAALLDENSWCGIIIDGHHVHYDAAKLAIKAKEKGKMMLVTDAMPPVGTTDESFPFFDSKVIRTGDRLNALTGELAGSCLDMAGAVINTIKYIGIEADEALRMAALYPASFLQLDNSLGRLQPGYGADFVMLDTDYNVTQTWIAGKRVH